MHRHELTDDQWAWLQPLLPPQTPRTGRPGHDQRRLLNGILWIHATGAPWRDLPERYGPWQTVACRFYRWVRAGVWDRLLAVLQQGDHQGQLDWETHYADSTVVRAHQHAAGARRVKGGPRSKRSDGAGEASRPSCTCGLRGAASPSPCC